LEEAKEGILAEDIQAIGMKEDMDIKRGTAKADRVITRKIIEEKRGNLVMVEKAREKTVEGTEISEEVIMEITEEGLQEIITEEDTKL